ncbi:cytosolic phospholipase A2 beta isoform X2 [Antennarius striatus]|uniref:cytosolic phospholipase A2 beta isoform X2 n=1 Tax=Antennarius striatus TaxID=241820 RepID=UPI0035B3FED7
MDCHDLWMMEEPPRVKAILRRQRSSRICWMKERWKIDNRTTLSFQPWVKVCLTSPMEPMDVTFWALDVTVLRAENINNGDYLSEADCYVTVSLPSQSEKVCRTVTVGNDPNPEWNETFTFTINDEGVKSTLEVCLYDEDPMKTDDLLTMVTLDISSLTPEEKETRKFTVNSEGQLWLAFRLRQSKKREERVHNHSTEPSAIENVSYSTLNVTILSATLSGDSDFMSACDGYVIVNLPTATAKPFRTKTVGNDNNPVWNEIVTFRVPTNVKNIIEFKLYDEDPLAPDNLITTLVFDIDTLTGEGKETKEFIITPETENKLLIEFELQKTEDPSSEYLSNGIIMAAPFCVLDVDTNQLTRHEAMRGKALKLRGAYEEVQTIDPSLNPQLRFYVNRDLETEIGVETRNNFNINIMESSVPLKPLQDKKTCQLSLVMEDEKVDFELKSNDWEDDYMAVRLDFDIPKEEKEFIKKRKVVVSQALQKLLGLEAPPRHEKLPTVAIVASGGGARAMTGLLGSLKGLKDTGILDAVTYMSALSGSTWALATLYQEANWSQQDIDEIISAAKEQMTKSVLSAFSMEKFQYYDKEILKKENNGYLVSFIDMAGLVLEHLVFGKKVTHKLSEQKKAVEEGQNPLPIYNAVNIKDGIGLGQTEAEWCEFTPYEVGVKKYGAFVQTEDFGSRFFLGRIIEKLPELPIPYYLGIWSSVFSINVTQMWSFATGNKPLWTPWLGPDINEIEVDSKQVTLDTTVIDGTTETNMFLTNFFKDRPVVAEMYNILRGFLMRWDYSRSSNFVAWKDTHPDAFPNQLTPNDTTMRLVDAGHAINIGCAPVLRPERDVDVIITLSYSWDPSAVCRVLKKTAAYCQDHNIPFPDVNYDELQKEPKEVYVIEDVKNPKAPIVVHFPLVNITFKDFKQPGVKRKTEEMKAGEVDVSTSNSPYTTDNMTFSEKDFSALIDLTSYNIVNNQDSILGVLRKAREKKAFSAED